MIKKLNLVKGKPPKTYGVVAMSMYKNGTRPIRINPEKGEGKRKGKEGGHGWERKEKITEARVKAECVSYAGHNVGSVLGDGLCVLDVDIDRQDMSDKALAIIERIVGHRPMRKYNGTNSSRFTIPFLCDENLGKSVHKFEVTDEPGVKHEIEILGDGQFFVAYGKHYLGGSLFWVDGEYYSTPRAELLNLTRTQIDEILNTLLGPLNGSNAEITSDNVKESGNTKVKLVNQSTFDSVDALDGSEGLNNGKDLPDETCDLMAEFVIRELNYGSAGYDDWMRNAFWPFKARFPDGFDRFQELCAIGEYDAESHRINNRKIWDSSSRDYFDERGVITFATMLGLCFKTHKDEWEKFRYRKEKERSAIALDEWEEKLKSIGSKKELRALSADFKADKRLTTDDREHFIENYEISYKVLFSKTPKSSYLRKILVPEQKKTKPEKQFNIKHQLIDDFLELGDPYRNQHGDALIDIALDGNDERITMLTHNQALNDFVMRRARAVYSSPIDKNGVSVVADNIAAESRSCGKVIHTHMRYAFVKNIQNASDEGGVDCLYVDSCDDENTIIEVSKRGVRAVHVNEKSGLPFRFLRAQDSAALPIPEPVQLDELFSRLNELWQFMNVPSNMRIPLLGYIVDAMMPHTHHPILNLVGDPGSGKSSLLLMIRKFIDPLSIPLTGAPRNTQDLQAKCSFNYYTDLDNISNLKGMEDSLCIGADNKVWTDRTYHTNDGKTTMFGGGPVGVSTISPTLFMQPDSRKRLLTIHVRPPVNGWKDNDKLEEDFDAALPRVYSAILALVSEVLRLLPNTGADKADHRHLSFTRVCNAVSQIMLDGRTLGELLVLSKVDDVIATEADHPLMKALQGLVGTRYRDCGYSGTAAAISREVVPVAICLGWNTEAYNKNKNNSDRARWIGKFLKKYEEPLDLMGMTVVRSPSNAGNGHVFTITPNDNLPIMEECHLGLYPESEIISDFDDIEEPSIDDI